MLFGRDDDQRCQEGQELKRGRRSEGREADFSVEHGGRCVGCRTVKGTSVPGVECACILPDSGISARSAVEAMHRLRRRGEKGQSMKTNEPIFFPALWWRRWWPAPPAGPWVWCLTPCPSPPATGNQAANPGFCSFPHLDGRNPGDSRRPSLMTSKLGRSETSTSPTRQPTDCIKRYASRLYRQPRPPPDARGLAEEDRIFGSDPSSRQPLDDC